MLVEKSAGFFAAQFLELALGPDHFGGVESAEEIRILALGPLEEKQLLGVGREKRREKKRKKKKKARGSEKKARGRH